MMACSFVPESNCAAPCTVLQSCRICNTPVNQGSPIGECVFNTDEAVIIVTILLGVALFVCIIGCMVVYKLCQIHRNRVYIMHTAQHSSLPPHGRLFERVLAQPEYSVTVAEAKTNSATSLFAVSADSMVSESAISDTSQSSVYSTATASTSNSQVE